MLFPAGTQPLAIMYAKKNAHFRTGTRRTARVFFGSPMPFPDGREMKFFAVLWTLWYAIAALPVLADRTGPGIVNRNFSAEQAFSITCTKAAHKCAALLF